MVRAQRGAYTRILFTHPEHHPPVPCPSPATKAAISKKRVRDCTPGDIFELNVELNG